MQSNHKNYFWQNSIGKIAEFSLEERIFNTMCIFAFFAMFIVSPYNYLMNLKVLVWVGCVCMVLISGLYYLSKVKRKSSLAITLFCIMSNLTFVYCYFYNSGILGPNVLLFALSFFFIIAIIPKAQYKFWVPVNILLVLAVLVIEFCRPQLAPDLYPGPLAKTIDFAVAYLVSVILIFLSIRYIRINYEHERLSVEQRNQEIEAQKEEILLQKAELEYLNREKDRLLSIVAHDVRMPLNSIQGYLEILNAIDLEEKEKQLIKGQLLQVTRDTSEMLLNLLSWSKMQVKGDNVTLEALDINEALRDWLKVEHAIAVKKGIRLEMLTAGRLHVMADHDMLHLVIRNLVSNALKFTPEGGEVVISTRYRGASGLIIISDNGIGITPEKQERLFQLNASATYGTNNEKGIGLGLLLCKEYTEKQQGNIWFETEIGKGSVFYISLKLQAV
ncbi:HAMP domain-containing sensor histidine kinase [Pedobacter sp. PLR]|uniref:HAMP domain-containing sensor histidine kinase n=1 Tax=Pedobacter sp. PLR TaxID=2994465 RepID=UPI002245A709|nr:HAMP domain-containing sensor histidine kinase [Pedobacter sp. PLR]MCX2451539.1 HAMP domain-containing sensor histidine kinase [Pedobacter sp. PLR]